MPRLHYRHYSRKKISPFQRRARMANKKKQTKVGGLKFLHDVSTVLNSRGAVDSTSAIPNFIFKNTCTVKKGKSSNYSGSSDVIDIKCNPESNRVFKEVVGTYSGNKFNGLLKVELDNLDGHYDHPDYLHENIHSYEGPVRNNKLHGDGKIVFKNGITFSGTFDDDKLVNGVVTYNPPRPAVKGELSVTSATGWFTYPKALWSNKPVTKYIGGILNGTPHSHKAGDEGVVTFSDGTSIIGEFKNGEIVDASITSRGHGMTSVPGSFRATSAAAAASPATGSSARQKLDMWGPQSTYTHGTITEEESPLDKVEREIHEMETGSLSMTDNFNKMQALYKKRDALRETGAKRFSGAMTSDGGRGRERGKGRGRQKNITHRRG